MMLTHEVTDRFVGHDGVVIEQKMGACGDFAHLDCSRAATVSTSGYIPEDPFLSNSSKTRSPR